jgi:hypothetical protein
LLRRLLLCSSQAFGGLPFRFLASNLRFGSPLASLLLAHGFLPRLLLTRGGLPCLFFFLRSLQLCGLRPRRFRSCCVFLCRLRSGCLRSGRLRSGCVYLCCLASVGLPGLGVTRLGVSPCALARDGLAGFCLSRVGVTQCRLALGCFARRRRTFRSLPCRFASRRATHRLLAQRLQAFGLCARCGLLAHDFLLRLLLLCCIASRSGFLRHLLAQRFLPLRITFGGEDARGFLPGRLLACGLLERLLAFRLNARKLDALSLGSLLLCGFLYFGGLAPGLLAFGHLLLGAGFVGCVDGRLPFGGCRAPRVQPCRRRARGGFGLRRFSARCLALCHSPSRLHALGPALCRLLLRGDLACRWPVRGFLATCFEQGR